MLGGKTKERSVAPLSSVSVAMVAVVVAVTVVMVLVVVVVVPGCGASHVLVRLA
jgi:hypothetical protein